MRKITVRSAEIGNFTWELPEDLDAHISSLAPEDRRGILEELTNKTAGYFIALTCAWDNGTIEAFGEQLIALVKSALKQSDVPPEEPPIKLHS